MCYNHSLQRLESEVAWSANKHQLRLDGSAEADICLTLNSAIEVNICSMIALYIVQCRAINEYNEERVFNVELSVRSYQRGTDISTLYTRSSKI